MEQVVNPGIELVLEEEKKFDNLERHLLVESIFPEESLSTELTTLVPSGYWLKTIVKESVLLGGVVWVPFFNHSMEYGRLLEFVILTFNTFEGVV
jgi:hypothetical protein